MEKYVNIPMIGEVFLVMLAGSLTEVVNPVATSILDVYKRVFINSTVYLT